MGASKGEGAKLSVICHSFMPTRKMLAPLVEFKLAAATLAAVRADRMSEEYASRILREATGTQWSLPTCMRYRSARKPWLRSVPIRRLF